MEIKRAQHEAMRKAKKVVEDVSAEFAKKTGRAYGLLESYKMDDADYAVIVMSSSAGTGKTAVDELRKQGKKAGLVKLRCYRPFPAEEIAAALKGVKALGIMDKTDSFNGFGGPLGSDVRAALYGHADGILTANYIYGLGGRDVKVDDFYEVFAELESGDAPRCRYLGVRE
jgi:pyruvate ferredoxin oxidoreductase alpha subunit